MNARARAERALPGVALRALGRGLDNPAFAAGDRVLRVAETDSVPREAALLAVLRDRVSLPVRRSPGETNGGVVTHRPYRRTVGDRGEGGTNEASRLPGQASIFSMTSSDTS